MNLNAEYREQNFIERKKRAGVDESRAVALYTRLKSKGVVA